MPSPGLEPAIPASERPQTYALDRAAALVDIILIGVFKLGRGPHCEGSMISAVSHVRALPALDKRHNELQTGFRTRTRQCVNELCSFRS